MSPNQPGASRYREIGVRTANPVQLVVMLYDGAIAALREAQEHVRGNDIAARCRCANRALAIISELQASLNFCDGGSIAVSLDRLYAYMKQLIFRGNFEHTCEPLAEASGLLESLRQAWSATAVEGQGMLPQAVPASAASDSEPQLTGINLSV